MNGSGSEQDPSKTLLCALIDDGAVALVRIVGRGNFSNSMAFKKFAAHVQQTTTALTLIVDFDACDAMDSTFMGVLAGISITQSQQHGNKVIVVNINDHCRRLLKNLGLISLLDVRSGDVEGLSRAEGALAPVSGEDCSRVQQICLTLQAHKDLVQLDKQNEVRFEAVIEYLEKSLAEEGGNN